jgi:hypothetical protein
LSSIRALLGIVEQLSTVSADPLNLLIVHPDYNSTQRAKLRNRVEYFVNNRFGGINLDFSCNIMQIRIKVSRINFVPIKG